MKKGFVMQTKKLFILLFMGIVSLNATSLRNSIEDTLNNNPSIIAAHINRDAYLKYVEQEEGDYLPTLDLDAYVEKSKTYNDPDTTPPAEGWSDKDGWNVALKFQYVLYDGGLTPAQVGEYQHRYNANKFRSIYDVENTIYETVSTYIDLVASQELLALATDNMAVHEKYLDIAKEKEEITGEVLETHQVNSKYHSVIGRYLEQEQEQYTSKSLYKQLVGKDLSGDICRPILDETFIPKTVKEAVELGLRRSFKINEQIEIIKQQREKIAQEKAGYRPTITFELQGQWDDDLELAENGRQDIYRGRINLNWNLFDGGKTMIATAKEELFLKEEQKKLDAITAEVVEEINSAYYTYFNMKKRVENSKKVIDDNYNILMVYKRQLADGTRTFIDILNAESELYRSDIDSLQQQFKLLNAYYDLLNKLSMLSDVILMQEKQICPKYVFTPRNREVTNPNEDIQINDSVKDLFTDDSSSDMNLNDDVAINNDMATDDLLGSDLSNNDVAPIDQQLPKEDEMVMTHNQRSTKSALDDLYSEPDNAASINLNPTPEVEPKKVTDTIETTGIIDIEDRLNKLYAEGTTPEIARKVQQRVAEERKELLAKKAQNEEMALNEKRVLSKQYTINIATLRTVDELKEFIKEYKLEDEAYYYRFGADRKKIKLIYGEFDTVGEARKAIEKFGAGIKNYVYVDNLQKHLDLEKKYNGGYNLAKSIPGKYTINIATVYSESELQKYIKEYHLSNADYSYRFGNNGDKIKLIYGSYNTLAEAKRAMAELPRGIRNYVYVDSVQKHIELEKKYQEYN